MKFEDGMIIHCPEKQQAWRLMNEVLVPAGKSKEEAVAGWDKYKDKTVYKLMMRPSWDKPVLMVFGSLDDEEVVGRKITAYTDIVGN